MYTWLHRNWYEGGSLYWVLLPLSGLYWLIVTLRRRLFRSGILHTYRAPVPVIIVGNITAGGTGKTPVTIWLGRELSSRGYRPGIASRGYGGSRSSSSMRVDGASDPAVVGDEPVLLARHTGCPVVVDRDRARAAQILAEEGADVVIADDGLQHYRLERDFEICVIDGVRGLGNRFLLPAGPMRETVSRLAEVDQVLVNGQSPSQSGLPAANGEHGMPFDLVATDVIRLDGSVARPIEEFSGRTVHAVAAIGNPRRFFDMLRSHGMQVIEHPFRDHAVIGHEDLDFGDELDVLMTEKDSVKLGPDFPGSCWSVPVRFTANPAASGALLDRIQSSLGQGKEQP